MFCWLSICIVRYCGIHYVGRVHNNITYVLEPGVTMCKGMAMVSGALALYQVECKAAPLTP